MNFNSKHCFVLFLLQLQFALVCIGAEVPGPVHAIPDQTPLFRAGLYEDLKVWQDKVQQEGQLRTQSIFDLAHEWAVTKGGNESSPQFPTSIKIILLYNNTWLHIDPYGNPNYEYMPELCARSCSGKKKKKMKKRAGRTRQARSIRHAAGVGGARRGLLGLLSRLAETDTTPDGGDGNHPQLEGGSYSGGQQATSSMWGSQQLDSEQLQAEFDDDSNDRGTHNNDGSGSSSSSRRRLQQADDDDAANEDGDAEDGEDEEDHSNENGNSGGRARSVITPGSGNRSSLKSGQKLGSKQCIWDQCNNHLKKIAKSIGTHLHDGGVQLPNALFLLHVLDNDGRLCSPEKNCSVPTFGLIKGIGTEPGDRDTDILVPQMAWTQPLVSVPWSDKKDVAFFRGRNFCGANKKGGSFEELCSRRYFARMSEERGPELGLDVGLTSELNDGYGPSIKGHRASPITAWVNNKWLLHFEGISASSRLGQLLSLNSLVLRALESNMTEHYYPLLQPWVHYVPFFTEHKDDLLDVLAEVRRLDREEPQKIQAMINAAQTFANTYLTEGAKLAYWKEAITQYKSLFADMDTEIEKLVATMRRAGYNFDARVDEKDRKRTMILGDKAGHIDNRDLVSRLAVTLRIKVEKGYKRRSWLLKKKQFRYGRKGLAAAAAAAQQQQQQLTMQQQYSSNY